MAQTKRKRKRKHAGTQAGTIERRGRTSKPGESKATAGRAPRANRLDQPPTWRGAATRAIISAVIFGVLVVVIFNRPPLAGLMLGAVMFVVYIPISYYTDRVLYNRRQQRKQSTGKS